MDGRVILIDDDLNLLHTVGDFLRASLNCEVHCASDRDEAGALINSYEYSLAVTDLALSSWSLDGLDVVDELAQLPQPPRIVVFTGCAAQDVKAAAIARGADAVFAKGRPISELASVARNLLATPAVTRATIAHESGLMESLLSRDGQITSLVQPIFQIGADAPSVFGVECLSRGPAGTPFERADALFAYARKKRREHKLDKACARQALSVVGQFPGDLRVTINMHASSFGRDPDLGDWLVAEARARQMHPSQILVEIVEHTPAWNEPLFLQTLKMLRSAGIGIAIDDVGLGGSNYQMILDVKPNCLKIDRHFVHNCHADPDRRAIITSMVNLASSFGAHVIGEGVEDRADMNTLQGLGVNLMQGFLLCRPIGRTEFLHRFVQGSSPSAAWRPQCPSLLGDAPSLYRASNTTMT